MRRKAWIVTVFRPEVPCSELASQSDALQALPTPTLQCNTDNTEFWGLSGLRCGRSSMVERELPKLNTRVRFPSPALLNRPRYRSRARPRLPCQRANRGKPLTTNFQTRPGFDQP